MRSEASTIRTEWEDPCIFTGRYVPYSSTASWSSATNPFVLPPHDCPTPRGDVPSRKDDKETAAVENSLDTLRYAAWQNMMILNHFLSHASTATDSSSTSTDETSLHATSFSDSSSITSTITEPSLQSLWTNPFCSHPREQYCGPPLSHPLVPRMVQTPVDHRLRNGGCSMVDRPVVSRNNCRRGQAVARSCMDEMQYNSMLTNHQARNRVTYQSTQSWRRPRCNAERRMKSSV